jgi:hypothetical protein
MVTDVVPVAAFNLLIKNIPAPPAEKSRRHPLPVLRSDMRQIELPSAFPIISRCKFCQSRQSHANPGTNPWLLHIFLVPYFPSTNHVSPCLASSSVLLAFPWKNDQGYVYTNVGFWAGHRDPWCQAGTCRVLYLVRYQEQSKYTRPGAHYHLRLSVSLGASPGLPGRHRPYSTLTTRLAALASYRPVQSPPSVYILLPRKYIFIAAASPLERRRSPSVRLKPQFSLHLRPASRS